MVFVLWAVFQPHYEHSIQKEKHVQSLTAEDSGVFK